MRSTPAAFSVLLVVSFSLWAAYPQFGQAVTTDFPNDRLRPCPHDWSQEDWNRYQNSRVNGFKGCMPRCCGYTNCYSPSRLKTCQDNCVAVGSRSRDAINPKTGRLAPPATLSRRATTDFPPDRLHPCPANWAREDWERYQEALISDFKGCMPRCCGYSNCNTNPSGLKQCQDHCIEIASHTGAAFNPKTGKMAPVPRAVYS